MGKATGWLKGLLGMKKEKNKENNSNCSGTKKENKRWSFAMSGKDFVGLNKIPGNISVVDTAWLRSYIAETKKEHNKHAIAVAAAAVAAAQTAVAVVRLTNHGSRALFNGGR